MANFRAATLPMCVLALARTISFWTNQTAPNVFAFSEGDVLRSKLSSVGVAQHLFGARSLVIQAIIMQLFQVSLIGDSGTKLIHLILE